MDVNRTARPRTRNPLVVGALALLPLAGAACAGDEPAGGGDTAGQQTTGAGDTEQRKFFSTDQFVGDEVTVKAVVTSVLGDKSFVLDGSAYGDESLLVLSAEGAKDLKEGEFVEVRGVVEEFQQANYRDKYGLIDDGVYQGYADEEFLAADNVRRDPSGMSSTATPSS